MKVYLMQQESKVDGDMLFNVVPCSNEETAKREMQKEIRFLLNESHFIAYIDRPDDTCDDYYEHIWIEEKEVL